jgi:hypothetical protein
MLLIMKVFQMCKKVLTNGLSKRNVSEVFVTIVMQI